MAKQTNVLNLRDAEAQLPPLDESAEAAKKLKAAMFEAVKDTDITEIMSAIKAKAKNGDLKAAKVLIDMIGQNSQTPRVMIGVRANAAGQGQNGTGSSGSTARGRPKMIQTIPPASPAATVLEIRRDCAKLLGKEGPLTTEDLEEYQENWVADEITAALEECEWFSRNVDGRWQLTVTGRKEAIG